MADALGEDVRPVALLVHDARERAVVVVPRRGWPEREALDAAESGVLDHDCADSQQSNRRRVEARVPPSVPRCATSESSFPEYRITWMPCSVALVAKSDKNAMGLMNVSGVCESRLALQTHSTPGKPCQVRRSMDERRHSLGSKPLTGSPRNGYSIEPVQFLLVGAWMAART